MTVAIIIPLYNQVHFTKLCIESLDQHTRNQLQIIAIDNASFDGTADYLASKNNITVISNSENLGCAKAWNQGVKIASDAEWIVILNNDVIVSALWLDGLISAANRWKIDIISPAIREGELNYNLSDYAHDYIAVMSGVIRRGRAHGICFAARSTVFKTIGPFDENYRIGQYEDTDYFLRAKNAGFRLGTVGSSFLHHFGSVTQNSMGKAREPKLYALENKAYFIRKWKLPWWKRAAVRNWNKCVSWLHSCKELLLHRHTLVEKWVNGRLRYF